MELAYPFWEGYREAENRITSSLAEKSVDTYEAADVPMR